MYLRAHAQVGRHRLDPEGVRINSIDWPDGISEDLKIQCGFGVYGGVPYWLNETIALDTRFDSFTDSSSHDLDRELGVDGGVTALANTPQISREAKVTGCLATLAV